jgi:hypothetical protein
MMRLRLTTAPASEPVTLAEAKDYARVDTSDSDTLITSLIKVARRRVESETGLALITQTWTGVLDRWPSTPAPDFRHALSDPYAGGLSSSGEWWDGVRDGAVAGLMPFGMVQVTKRPFLSVDSIKVRDIDLSFMTVDSTAYYVEISDWYGRIGRKPNVTWPVPRVALGAIEIQFQAGFGAAAAAVPDDLQLAIKMLVAHWLENREPVVEGGRIGMMPVPSHLPDILASWRETRL